MFVKFDPIGPSVAIYVELAKFKNRMLNYWPRMSAVDQITGEMVEVFAPFHWYALNRHFMEYDSNGYWLPWTTGFQIDELDITAIPQTRNYISNVITTYEVPDGSRYHVLNDLLSVLLDAGGVITEEVMAAFEAYPGLLNAAHLNLPKGCPTPTALARELRAQAKNWGVDTGWESTVFGEVCEHLSGTTADNFIDRLLAPNAVRMDSIAKDIYRTIGTSYMDLRAKQYSKINHIWWYIGMPPLDPATFKNYTASDVAVAVNRIGEWDEYQACLAEKTQLALDNYNICIAPYLAQYDECVAKAELIQDIAMRDAALARCTQIKDAALLNCERARAAEEQVGHEKCKVQYTRTVELYYEGETTSDAVIIANIEKYPERYMSYLATQEHPTVTAMLFDKEQVLFKKRYTITRNIVVDDSVRTKQGVVIKHRTKLVTAVRIEYLMIDNALNQLTLMQKLLDNMIDVSQMSRVEGATGRSVLVESAMLSGMYIVGEYGNYPELAEITIMNSPNGVIGGLVELSKELNPLYGREAYAKVYLGLARASGYYYLLKRDYVKDMRAVDFAQYIGSAIQVTYEKKKQSTLSKIGNILVVIVIVVIAVITGQPELIGIAFAWGTATAMLLAMTFVLALGSYIAAQLGFAQAAIVLGKIAQVTGFAATVVGAYNMAIGIGDIINAAANEAANQAVQKTVMEVLLDKMIEMVMKAVTNISTAQIMNGAVFVGQQILSAQQENYQDDIDTLNNMIIAQEEEIEQLTEEGVIKDEDDYNRWNLINPRTWEAILTEQGMGKEFVGPFQPLQQIELDLSYPIEHKIPMSLVVNGG